MFSDEEATSNLAISSIEPAVFSAAPTVGFGTASDNSSLIIEYHMSSSVLEESFANGRWMGVDSRFGYLTRAVQEREVKKRPMTKPCLELQRVGQPQC